MSSSSKQKICFHCKRPNAKLFCSRCHEAYCDTSCQVSDWATHKYICYNMPDLVNYETLVKKFSSQCSLSTLDGNAKAKEVPIGETRKSTPIFKWKIPALNIENKGEYAKYTITHVDSDDPTVSWVMRSDFMDNLKKMTAEIMTSVCETVKLSDLYAGNLVIALFAQELFRAEVLQVNQQMKEVSLRFIDYGRKVLLPYACLYEPPKIAVDQPAMAVQVRLPKGSEPMQPKEQVYLRIIDSLPEDGVYFAELKRQTLPTCLSAELLSKDPELILKKILKVDREALVVQKVSSGELSNQLSRSLAAVQSKNFDLNEYLMDVDVGTFVAALVAGGWRRALIVGAWPEGRTFVVYLVDEGCVQVCKQLMRIPNELFTEPMRAFTISGTFDKVQLKAANVLKIIPKCLGTDTAVPCSLEIDGQSVIEVKASAPDGLLHHWFNNWTESIADGDIVFIASIFSHCEVYIALKATVEYEKMFSSIAEKCDIYEIDERIAEGDLVLFQVPDTKSYARGMVAAENSRSDTFYVFDIDAGCNWEVKRSALRKPNQFVRSCPINSLKVSLMYLNKVLNPPKDSAAMGKLEMCRKMKCDFTVKFSKSSQSDQPLVDLFFGEPPTSLGKNLIPQLFEIDDENAQYKSLIKTADTAKANSCKSVGSMGRRSCAGSVTSERREAPSSRSFEQNKLPQRSMTPNNQRQCQTAGGWHYPNCDVAGQKTCKAPDDGHQEQKPTDKFRNDGRQQEEKPACKGHSSGGESASMLQQGQTNTVDRCQSPGGMNAVPRDDRRQIGVDQGPINGTGNEFEKSKTPSIVAESPKCVDVKNDRIVDSAGGSKDERAGQKFTIDDIPLLEIPIADNVTLALVDFSNFEKKFFITVHNITDKKAYFEFSDNLKSVMKLDKNLCTPEGFEPKAMEVILAIFADDGDWYRAVILGNFDDDAYKVLFVDFGNVGLASKKSVLPMPADMMFPTMANNCYIKGVNEDNVLDVLKGIADKTHITCKVIGKDAYNSYIIEIDM